MNKSKESLDNLSSQVPFGFFTLMTHADIVLKQYGRELAQLRTELDKGRFGLILGAGVSQPLNFPGWNELVVRIAEHPDVSGKKIVESAEDLSPTTKTQMLYQHYRSKSLGTTNSNEKIDRKIQGAWRQIIREALYRNAPGKAEEIRDLHPYLAKLVPVIKKSSIVINYNFDDSVERLIMLFDSAINRSVRSFETVWNTYLPFKANTTIIYHPNGYLPSNFLENPSETIVFSEESFADQLIQSMAGYHASILNHLSQRTCLLLGLSLSDGTLRHLLRQSALINPGHYHYIVKYIRKEKPLSEETKSAIRDANFAVYNLVTLFLENEKIAALSELLLYDQKLLKKRAEKLGAPISYFYYLSGTIGSGKTSVLDYMGSMKTYEEWIDTRPEKLAINWRDLDKGEAQDLDTWIVSQFEKRNSVLIDEDLGVHVCDRSPLDPLGFTESVDIPKKARFIQLNMSPGESKRSVQSGQIILLTGHSDELETRVIARRKQSSAAQIDEIQNTLRGVFDCQPPVIIIDTSGLSIPQVVKRVARAILLDDYKPVDLTKRLADLAGDSGAEARD